MQNYDKINRFDILAFAALAIGVFALYWPFRASPMIFDDVPFFQSENFGGSHFEFFQRRSLSYATFYFERYENESSLIKYRIENIFLHILTVFSMYFLGIEIYKKSMMCDFGGVRRMAFGAAAIFAMHPVCTYAVGYLIQRSIVMATLFCLLSVLAYVRSESRDNVWWAWVSVICYGIAVQSKEHAIMLPLLIFALMILEVDDWFGRLKARWFIFVAMGVFGASVVFQHQGILGSVYENAAPNLLRANSTPYIDSILTQAFLFFKYIGLWIFPNPNWLSIDIRVRLANSGRLFDWLFLIAYIGWGVIGFILLFKRENKKAAGFMMLFPWLMFLTEFSTVRAQEAFVLYRSYLWMPGLVFLIPLVAKRLSNRSMKWVGLALLVALPFASVDRLMVMSNSIYLWEDAKKLVEDDLALPGSYRIYYNLGVELLRVKRPNEAIVELNKSILLGGDFAEAYNNLGVADLQKSEWLNALEDFTKAINIASSGSDEVSVDNVAKGAYGRARAYQVLGRLIESSADYKLSCKLRLVGCEVKLE